MIQIKTHTQKWHKGLLSCFDAFPICLLSCCCPVIGVGIVQYMAHKKVPKMSSSLSLCLSITFCCVGNSINRKRMRAHLNLPGICLCEILLYALCCYSCLVLQEYQEINWRVLNEANLGNS